ncbi:MAG: hypothetical protein M0R74_09820 [Dehalococcoidia bacterium]|nr:hypothetical protein [Dehalococcoidia bacterium]
MDLKEAIGQLDSLRAHCKTMISGGDEIWRKDAEALDMGMAALASFDKLKNKPVFSDLIKELRRNLTERVS